MDAPSTAPPPSPEVPEAQHRELQLQLCPGCGHHMPSLKGARLSICPVCGYKESCCY